MREYQVGTASTQYWNKNKGNDEVSIVTAFEEGAKWADEHPKNPWISVEERLPEKTRNLSPFPDEYDEKVVLVINKQGGKRLAYRDYKGVWRDDYTCEIVNQNYARITHWMPIPQIKKGE